MSGEDITNAWQKKVIQHFLILLSSANGVCQYLELWQYPGAALEGGVSPIANGIAVSWPHIDKSWELDIGQASLLMQRSLLKWANLKLTLIIRDKWRTSEVKMLHWCDQTMFHSNIEIVQMKHMCYHYYGIGVAEDYAGSELTGRVNLRGNNCVRLSGRIICRHWCLNWRGRGFNGIITRHRIYLVRVGSARHGS